MTHTRAGPPSAGDTRPSAVKTFIGGEPPSLDGLRARYEQLLAGRSADWTEIWHNWTVRRTADGVAVGTVQATETDAARRAEVAWVIGAEWQGQGYATEAAAAMIAWLVARGATDVTAHVHPDHAASNAVAERRGAGRRVSAAAPAIDVCVTNNAVRRPCS